MHFKLYFTINSEIIINLKVKIKMKNRFFVLWAMLGLVSFIAAMDVNKPTGSKSVTKDE